MTGDRIPSSACTRRPDEICTDDFPAKRGGGGGGARRWQLMRRGKGRRPLGVLGFRSCNWLVEEREVAAIRALLDLVELRSGFRLLPESSGFLAGLVVAQYKFFGVSCIAPAFHFLLFISVVLLLSVLGFDPMSLRGLVCSFVALFSGNPGSTAGRGFNPAGGAPGGG
ncbi:hypothetical protein F511_18533 [Dorcoceras hygrometricum]|uniref:Uncharacterized protein n=1 Tax=Dorcoceras hygrometricum TaxID=472368 RepID=A0A2Z7ALP6_9LAMI|nr:hypothetical protein F511_18533 [Dorcoceras hygrometricum]